MQSHDFTAEDTSESTNALSHSQIVYLNKMTVPSLKLRLDSTNSTQQSKQNSFINGDNQPLPNDDGVAD